MGVVLGGSTTSFNYYIGLNQFWAIERVPAQGEQEPNYPRVISVGGLRLDMPSIDTTSTYYAEQDVDEARVKVIVNNSDKAFSCEAFVAVNNNTLIISLLHNDTKPVPINVTTWTTPGGDVPRQTKAGCTDSRGQTANCTGSTTAYGLWISRQAYPNSPYPVTVGVGTRIWNAQTEGTETDNKSYSTARVLVSPNVAATIFTNVMTNKDSGMEDPVPAVQSYLLSLSNESVTNFETEHKLWWKQYWNMSSISLPQEPLIENYWYGAQYILACSSRDGKVAPGLWGPWVTTDSAAWHGDYTLNYNFQAPFYGTYSSNRLSMALSQYKPILDYIPQGRMNSKAFNCTGLHYPVHIAPWGFSGSLGPRGNLRQHSTASFCALNFISHWEYSMNMTFLKTVAYPFVTEVAEFWECWLQKENTDTGYRWVDPHDCTNENCGGDPSDFNSIVSLTFIQRIFSGLIDMAKEMGMEPKPLWLDFLQNLSNYSTINVTVPNVGPGLIWQFSEPTSGQVKPPSSHINPLNLYPIWPSEVVNLATSEDDQLTIGKNSVLYMSSWTQGNAFMEIFPAAVRVRLDASILIPIWRDTLSHTMLKSLYVSEGGGGVETAGGTQAVNDMLMQSVGGIISFFPVWPDGEDASFVDLRAKGAFLVSASYNGTRKTIDSPIRIYSEAGRNCSVLRPLSSPWQDIKVMEVLANGSKRNVGIQWTGTKLFTFQTSGNTVYEVTLS
jgi:hypothetical protein